MKQFSGMYILKFFKDEEKLSNTWQNQGHYAVNSNFNPIIQTNGFMQWTLIYFCNSQYQQR